MYKWCICYLGELVHMHLNNRRAICLSVRPLTWSEISLRGEYMNACNCIHAHRHTHSCTHACMRTCVLLCKHVPIPACMQSSAPLCEMHQSCIKTSDQKNEFQSFCASFRRVSVLRVSTAYTVVFCGGSLLAVLCPVRPCAVGMHA